MLTKTLCIIGVIAVVILLIIWIWLGKSPHFDQ